MYQLVKGTAHCHLHGVMHRDLKPQNLLVGEDAAGTILKIADLGLGRAFSIPIKTYTHEVTPPWWSPLRAAPVSQTGNRPAAAHAS